MKTRMTIQYWVPIEIDNAHVKTFHLMAESKEEAYQKIDAYLTQEGFTFFHPLVKVEDIPLSD